jgi:broad specificity phosphatase PhoE
MSDPLPQQQKTFFLIRHGESTWNQAKSRFNLWRLCLYRDHALTRKGVRQAADLNSRWKSVIGDCSIVDDYEDGESEIRVSSGLIRSLEAGGEEGGSSSHPPNSSTGI